MFVSEFVRDVMVREARMLKLAPHVRVKRWSKN